MFRGSRAIPGRRFQWAVDEPISSVPMLRYPLLPSPTFSILSLFSPHRITSHSPFLRSSPSHFSLLLFLLLFLSVNLSSCVSPLVCFLSLHHSRPPKLPSPRNRLSFSLSLRLHPEPDSRSICDLEGFRAEAGHYGSLSRLGNTEYRGPILSAGKFIARSTLIGREIIGHSFSPSARSKRLSLIHDFSRIIAGPCHRLPPFPLSLPRFRFLRPLS